MSSLPRKKPIQFFRDLADQNAFQIATRGLWQVETIDLCEHVLNGQNGRLDPICCVNAHDVASVKNEKPRITYVILGSG
jgi:hypothetical protein